MKSIRTENDAGKTPVKLFYFDPEHPSASVPLATPSRIDATTSEILKSAFPSSSRIFSKEKVYESPGETERQFSRPKTSRIIPNPSPEVFFDYVVSSPPTKGHLVTSELEIFGANDDALRKSGNASIDFSRHLPTDHKRRETAVRLGCWLFGSILRS
jgi:hypothetical protein